MPNTEGLIPLQAPLEPNNGNDRSFVSDSSYIKGGPQVFQTIEELVAYHPNRMKKGMSAKVMNWPGVGTVTMFAMNAEPAALVDTSGASIITIDNFDQFWNVEQQIETTQIRVRQYAPDGPGGGAPVFPYTLGTESNWSTTLDYTKGHRWMRFRDDDIDDDSDGIFDNWSVPISIGNAFQSGDYIDKRFKRQNTSNLHHTSTGTLTSGKYYSVELESVQITGNLALNEIGEYGTETVALLNIGRVFKYASSNAYLFNGSAYVLEVLQSPPRTISGLVNNDPVGWDEEIPVGAEQLWSITGQKSIYGQLKSDWILTKIIENPDYTRYSNSPSPYPGTIAGVNTPATSGSAEDIALEAAGWAKVYAGQNFIARREDDPGANLYTEWIVEKINEESGEYVDRVFKLFDLNLDSDNIALVPPTERDASIEGWSDTVVPETDTQINYVSEARKFFNGELKTAWSKPVPYTGKDVFDDTISSDLGDNFKYTADGAVTPALITLQANLYKGTGKLWESEGMTISYVWKKVYDGGVVVDISPTSSSGDDFYKIAASGTPGTPGYLQADQRVGIKPNAVDGHSVFRCTQTISMAQGDDLVFEDEFSILDITDGKDAKSLAMSADIQTVLFDNTTALHVPGSINLRAYSSNIVSPVYYWYRYVSGSWVKFTVANANHVFPLGVNGGTLHLDIFSGTPTTVIDAVLAEPGSGADLTLSSAGNHLPAMIVNELFEIRDHSNTALNGYYKVITVTTSTTTYQVNKLSGGAPADAASESITVYTGVSYLFAADQTKEEIRYAVSTHSSNPDSADQVTTFSDYTTVVKLGSSAVGSPGIDGLTPLLDNESHTVIIDSSTSQPISGEITSSGKAITKVELYDGATKKVYTTDYTISLASDNANITFAHQADGTDRRVYISAWTAGERRAVCTITFTYGSLTLTRKFTIASTVDAPGAILLDIDSDKGYEFTPDDKGNKVLTARLYNTNLSGTQLITLPDADYTFRWNVAGSWGSLSTTNTKTITRANILSSAQITVEAYYLGVLYRSRTINMSDVNDGRTYRAFTVATSVSNIQKLTTQDPTAFGGTVTVGGVAWKLQTDTYWNTNVAVFAQDAIRDAVTNTWTWYAPIKIKGEAGDQGIAGNFFLDMYRAVPAGVTPVVPGSAGNAATPSDDIASLATLQTAGWTPRPPSTGIIWKTSRLWTGQGVTFDVNGVPTTGPVTGSKWVAPMRISGSDGVGTPGDNGTNGWMPTWAVVAGAVAGTKVIQLTGWFGGTGTTPTAYVNQYVTNSGFSPTLALANPVTGEPVELRNDATSGFVQWKYTNEGAGLWRNLYAAPGAHASPNTWSFNSDTLTPAGTLGGVTNWFGIDTGNTTSKKLAFRAFGSFGGGSGNGVVAVAAGNTYNSTQQLVKTSTRPVTSPDADITCEGMLTTTARYLFVYIIAPIGTLNDYGLTVTQVV